ncbi:MAG: hypothetical protein KHY62_01420 [Firmicutes bacterium]|nr:hypothetical protein [Bacillota bacterium]
MEFEKENLMSEDIENTDEPTVEEMVEGEAEAAEEEKEEKVYTESELNARVDELLARKMARQRDKLKREYEEKLAPYKKAENILNAGLGTNNIAEAADNLTEFYKEKGIKIPETNQNTYSEEDLKVLADSEAQKIIDSGMEDVIDEVDRLAEKGVKNMTAREKLVFSSLAKYRQAEGAREELRGMGVKNEVIDSDDFKDFASKFNQGTPIKEVYDLYTKTHEKTRHIEKMGSMKNGAAQEVKTYYTPEEVDKLTEKDLDNPKIFEAVRNSMSNW